MDSVFTGKLLAVAKITYSKRTSEWRFASMNTGGGGGEFIACLKGILAR